MNGGVILQGSMRFISYDPATYDFAELLRGALGVRDLTGLVADASGEAGWSIYKVMERSTQYRAFWVLTETAAFAELYARFVKRIVVPLFDGPILVQSHPTPRIVYADQTGESRFHRDRDYGHDGREINFQVTLTPSIATNAMWIESVEGSGDYHPAELEPGRMLMFDGANLSHGAVPNQTGRSRVSFDFRAILEADAGRSHRERPRDGEPARGAHVFASFC